MTAWSLAVRSFVRGLRAGRLTVLMVALTVAVTAITSAGFFIDRVRVSVEHEAAGVLAADLRIRASEPLNEDYRAAAERLGLATAEVVSFPTVVMAGDAGQLATLYAVSAGYPLRGQVRVADASDAATYAASGGPATGQVWAEAGLLARLNADVGSRLSVGAAQLTVDRILKHRPDQTMGFDSFAPSLLMNAADLPTTDLIRPGSRASWAALFAGEASDVEEFQQWFATARQPGERLQTAARSGARTQAAVARAESFLSLAAMITLLLAATAVAVAARRYAALQVDEVALMKCLGARQSLVLTATLIELGILGVVTGLVGSALGYLAQFGLAALVAD
ncbi:MAG: ABC transporter permease, partial [Gammaproteobacteria bacterium]|nr:ABC transporter permease [Gammaproteobacteria bacterium]